MSETIRNIVTCSICTEIFQNPRTVNCGHTYCETCITDIHKDKRSKSIPCPLCNADISTDFKKNIVIAQLIEELIPEHKQLEKTITDICKIINGGTYKKYVKNTLLSIKSQIESCTKLYDISDIDPLTLKLIFQYGWVNEYAFMKNCRYFKLNTSSYLYKFRKMEDRKTLIKENNLIFDSIESVLNITHGSTAVNEKDTIQSSKYLIVRKILSKCPNLLDTLKKLVQNLKPPAKSDSDSDESSDTESSESSESSETESSE